MSQITWLTIFAVIFAVFAFDSILVIDVHRRVCGKFKVSINWQRLFSFTSSTGSFSIRNDLRQIHCDIEGQKTVLGFEHLRSLEFRTRSEAAILGEVVLVLDMEEHWKEERDYIIWNTVFLTSNRGISIPVFKSGKYVRRKYLHEFYSEAQLAILETCQLLVNVDEQCQAVISQLERKLHLRVQY